MNAWAQLSDAQLLDRMRAMADRCVAVVNLPEAERRAGGAKGEASPEQAGALSAALVLQAAAECERRGIKVW